MLRRFIELRERYVVGSAVLALMMPVAALAQGDSVSRPVGVPQQFRDFPSTIKNIFTIVITVAGVLFVGLFLFGGIQYLASAGNEDNTKKARTLMLDAVIGLVIVVTSWALGTYVLQLLGVQGASSGNLQTTQPQSSKEYMVKLVRSNYSFLLLFIAVAAFFVATVPDNAHAATLALPTGLKEYIPAVFYSVNSAFRVVWDTVLGVAGLAFLGYLLYGGFIYLTSAGDETVATRAKHTLRDAGIGMALVALAWPIGLLVLTFLGQQGIIKDGTKTEVPTASSSTPLSINNNSSTGLLNNGTNTGSGNTGTTPPTNSGSTTGSGGTGTIPPGTTDPQTPVVSSNIEPGSSFSVIQPGQTTQRITANQSGQANYTLNPSFTYVDTDIYFVSKQTNGVVGGLVVNINRQATGSNYQAMYSNVQVGANGRITLKLPVGEKIRIINASTNVEYLKDQLIQAGGSSIQAIVP